MRNIWPKIVYIKDIYISPMQMQSHGLNMTPMSNDSRELLYDESQKELKIQSKTKLVTVSKHEAN